MAYFDSTTKTTHAVPDGNIGASVRKVKDALGMDGTDNSTPSNDPTNPLAKYGIDLNSPIKDDVCFGCDKHQ